MLLSLSYPAKAQIEDFPRHNAQPQSSAQVDTQQAFQLIDRILPFEACLYHQILPLSLDDRCLQLGMVSLEDVAALDYVRRILSFMNYSLVPQSIASEAHYAILSAYLNHTKNTQPPAMLEPAPQPPSPEVQKKIDRHTQETFIVDAPDELEGTDLPIPQRRSTIHPTELPGELQKVVLSDRQNLLKTHVTDPELARTFILNAESSPPQDLPTPGDALPTLTVTTHHQDSPVEFLATLPPAQLLQELLGRILLGGIGRLYFERKAQSGRVLWSQNGILQSVLQTLPLEVFQGVIDELKGLTRLPLTTVQKPVQVEIERIYQKSRLLLRLRVMPGTHGEEATLQILRGAALKFYQQQQLANLSRDALTIAQELQKKVDEIRDRTHSSSQALDPTTVVPNLSEVLHLIEQQLEALKRLE
jgi:type II secretory ATPase GspE/PulE/Tfp pilus assembly ATPase PilB-like protein